jgi:O-antigen ligase
MWQMGYHFAGTIGIHAPALNMHLAFVSICNLYFAIFHFKESKKIIIKAIHLLLFIISFILLLIINTRIALLVSCIGYFLVIIYYFFKNRNIIQLIKTVGFFLLIISLVLVVFIKNNHFMEQKYNRMIFDKLEMVGKLDKIQRPEVEIYSSLVTRLSIWKSTIDLSKEHLLFGVGSSDSRKELINYYKATNQKFLFKYKLPVHNQYLDFLLRFGVLGLIGALVYICYIGYIGFKLKNVIIITFFLLFFICNLTDDFLIRFDGIIFSGFWASVFTSNFFKSLIE